MTGGLFLVKKPSPPDLGGGATWGADPRGLDASERRRTCARARLGSAAPRLTVPSRTLGGLARPGMKEGCSGENVLERER